MDTLPEELVEHILAYHLYPAEHFLAFIGSLRWSWDSTRRLEDAYLLPADDPAIAAANARSGLLLVCKQWLRIGRPLLYHSFRIKTSRDVQIAHGLFSAHPSLGHAVRRLRVESTDLEGLDMVLQYFPNVHTLYISQQSMLSEPQTRPVPSFVCAMQKLNPTRVLLWKPYRLWSGTTGETEVTGLATAIAKWTNLTQLDLSDHYIISPAIASSLSTLPRLQEIHMSAYGALCSLVNESLQKIAENSNLTKISCGGAAEMFYMVECKRTYPGRAANLLSLKGRHMSPS